MQGASLLPDANVYSGNFGFIDQFFNQLFAPVFMTWLLYKLAEKDLISDLAENTSTKIQKQLSLSIKARQQIKMGIPTCVEEAKLVNGFLCFLFVLVVPVSRDWVFEQILRSSAEWELVLRSLSDWKVHYKHFFNMKEGMLSRYAHPLQMVGPLIQISPRGGWDWASYFNSGIDSNLYSPQGQGNPMVYSWSCKNGQASCHAQACLSQERLSFSKEEQTGRRMAGKIAKAFSNGFVHNTMARPWVPSALMLFEGSLPV